MHYHLYLCDHPELSMLSNTNTKAGLLLNHADLNAFFYVTQDSTANQATINCKNESKHLSSDSGNFKWEIGFKVRCFQFCLA